MTLPRIVVLVTLTLCLVYFGSLCGADVTVVVIKVYIVKREVNNIKNKQLQEYILFLQK